MAERVEREPTLEEIVVALRETRRGASRGPPFTVVVGQPGNRASSTAPRVGVDAQNGRAGATDISDLRDGEIGRLLTENARLNKRIVFLLKVIERDRARTAELAARQADTETDQSGISGVVSKALEAELRPVLLVLLRLLQEQRASHRLRRHLARPPRPPELLLPASPGVLRLTQPLWMARPTTQVGSSISMRCAIDLAWPYAVCMPAAIARPDGL